MKKRSKKTINYNRYFYYFIAPFVLIYLTFSFYPLAYSVALSFSDMAGFSNEYNFVGLENYVKLVTDDYFFTTLFNTLRIWFFNFIPQLGFALLFAAWFTDISLKMKYTGVFKAIIFMPYLLTQVSVAMLFQTIFAAPSGLVNQVLVQLQVLPEAFEFWRSKPAAILLVAFIYFWQYVGYTLLIFMSGITGVSTSLYEAAIVDGANMRQTFFKITIPLLKPIILYLMIMTIVGGLQIFEVPYVIGDESGRPDGVLKSVLMYLYTTAFQGSNNYGYAAALSVGLFLVMLLLSSIAFRMLGTKEDKR